VVKKVAALADIHLHYSYEVSPALDGLVKPPFGDGIEYGKKLYRTLERLEREIKDGKLDEIVILGDFLDAITGEGLNILERAYERVAGGEGEREKILEEEFQKIGDKWKTPRDTHYRNFLRAFENFERLVGKVRALSRNGKLKYIIGNHENGNFLKRAGIGYVEEVDYGPVILEHGHKGDSLLLVLGWSPQHLPRILTQGSPYRRSVADRVKGVARNMVRAYGFILQELKQQVFNNSLVRGMVYSASRKIEKMGKKPRIMGHYHMEEITPKIAVLGEYNTHGIYYIEIGKEEVSIFNGKGEIARLENGIYRKVA